MTQSLTRLNARVSTCTLRLLGAHIVNFGINGAQIASPLTHMRQYRDQVTGAILASARPDQQVAVVVPYVDEQDNAIVRGLFGNEIPLGSEELATGTQLPVGFITSTAALGAWLRSGQTTTQIPTSDPFSILEIQETPTHIVITAGTSLPDGSVTFGRKPSVTVMQDDPQVVDLALAEALADLDAVGGHLLVHMQTHSFTTALRQIVVDTPWRHGERAFTTATGAITMGVARLVAQM